MLNLAAHPMAPNSPVPATHAAFGLTWSFPFPFLPFKAAAPGQSADVVVELGLLPPLSALARQAGPLRQVYDGSVRFGLPGVAKLLVSGGNHILVEPHPDGSAQALHLMLMGTAAALVLLQRGALPLHGSAIATAKGAVLFVGHSGAGKSTTLGAFLRRGYNMICDDLATIRMDEHGVPQVCPGATMYKLWADSAEALGVATESLPRVRSELEKFMVPASDLQAGQSLQVHAVYQLKTHNGSGVLIEPRLDAGKFSALLDHTWQKLTVKAMGLHAAHFQRAVMMANRVRVISVRRPDSGVVDADRLAAAIEADFLG